MSEPAPLALLLEGPAAEAEAWLASWGFEAPGPARRALQALFRGVRDPAFALRFLDALLPRLADCPDPDRALNHLERWVAQLSSARDTVATLTDNIRLFDDLLLLFGTSDYLADILVREPTAYTLMLGEQTRPPDLPSLRARLDAAVDLFPRTPSRLDALRRFKRRELLRIAWRDLTGRDDFATVVQAISDLTEALIGKALAVCQADLAARDEMGRAEEGVTPPAPGSLRPEPRREERPRLPPFAVVAMGKLGGRELNYSSDVDLLFLCDVDAEDERGLRQATRLAEELVGALSRPTAEGHLFRVDMRLRPEGRYGALVRSLASYREYYDHWVETWERQALLKARFIAGDAGLGDRFERMIEPHVYRRLLSTAIFEDVRDVKLAIERRVNDAGQAHTNVKEGRGTIRDIEFTVQLLQLLFGGERPELRVRATLPAIERLAAAGLLPEEEAASLSEHYRFFRTVEHRLQLMSDLPVRLLPDAPNEQRKLARRMGYPPEAADRFMPDYAARAEAVRRITGEIVDRLAGPTGRAGDGATG